MLITGICGCDDAKHREMEMQVAILKDRNEQLKAENENLKDGLDSAQEQIDLLQKEVDELKDKQSKLGAAIDNGTAKIGNLVDLKEIISGALEDLGEEDKESLKGLFESAAAAANVGKELDLPEFKGLNLKELAKQALEKRKKVREERKEQKDSESSSDE